MTDAPVVVGIDGSGSARAAVRWAAREAVRRGVTLRIVYADVFALPVLPDLPRLPANHHAQVRVEVQRWLAQAAEAATYEAPDVVIETASRAGSPVTVLIDESDSAGLVVVGDRGRGGFIGLLAGSVAVAVAAHGHSSTVIVRRAHQALPTSGPVVVGVDGSREADVLLSHAFDAAASLNAPLHVVHTWNVVGVDAKWVPADLASRIQDNEQRWLAEGLSGWSEKYPDVAAHHFVVRGSAPAELLRRGADAQLLVVGSRGRGGFTGMLLGSTSQALIHHAPCPVLVVRSAG